VFVPPRCSEDEARFAIATSVSWSAALRKLGMRPAGGDWKTLQRYAREVWDISADRRGRRMAEQRYCSRACGTRHERVRGPRPSAWKVERPPYEQLVREIAETNYVAAGRKYGVSDNAIRKWVRAYERKLGVEPLPRAA
jgi:hypothetical protein